jgi:hypothetical protein
MRTRIEIGQYRSEQFAEMVRVATDVFRIAMELEPTPAAKIGYYEDLVAVFKEIERFTTMRVNAGVDPPQHENLARFYRLQAEADLIQLKESLKGGK